MSKKRLKCFAIMSRGQFYRPNGRIMTVHACSKQYAKTLLGKLKKSGKFSKNQKVSFKQIYRCDPESGELCYYKMIAQPSYGITPKGELLPNSPEWAERVEGKRQTDNILNISARREDIINNIRKKRSDLYE